MKIKKTEAVFAAVNFICVKLFITAPQCFINIGKNAAWIAVLINATAAFLAFLAIYGLYVKSGRADLFSVMPKPLRYIAGILIVLYFVLTSGISLALLIRGVIRTFMPKTPSVFISALFAAATIYASSKGVKANIRLSMLFAPLLLIIAAAALSLIPHLDFTNLFPLLGDNNFYLPSLFGFNFFSDFIVFFVMMPYFDNKRDVLLSGGITIGVSALLCMIMVLGDSLTIPYTAKFVSPFYQMLTFMAESNSAVDILKIFKLAFLLNFFLYMSSSAAFAADTLRRAFNLKYAEKTVWILTVLMLLTEEIKYRTMTLPEVYSNIMEWTFLIFPLIPFLGYLLGRRKKSEKN